MEFELEDPNTLTQKILDLQIELGTSVPIRDIAREALERRFWPESTIDGAVMVWASKQVRDALHKDNPVTGVQNSVPIEKGSNPRWKPTHLLNLEEANFTLQDHAASMTKDYLKLVALHEFFVKKFGGGISSIPRLI